MSAACLGDALSALVDGELDHAARERALTHLTGCADCRAEVAAERRLKARLAGLDATTVTPSALTGRLLALAVPGVDPAPAAPAPPVAVRPVPVGPPGRQAQPARPPDRRPARTARANRRRRRSTTGVMVVVGLGAALALGGPRGGSSSTPLDPGDDVFVVEHASTTGTLPLREPAARVATLPDR